MNLHYGSADVEYGSTRHARVDLEPHGTHPPHRGVKSAIEEADAVAVSPISVYEVSRKARLGGWPEVVGHLDELVAESQTVSAPFTRGIAARAGTLDWRHRDPFDRLIAATAIELRYPLVSKDVEFDALDGMPGWRGRVWSKP